MSDGHRLVQAMRRAGQTPQNEIVDLVTGEVTSVSPLKVKVESRELTESFLILGALCKETHIYTDNIKLHAGSVPSSEFDLLLWRGLEVGDKVLMIKMARGQKYYILQREEGVIPT